MCITINNLKAEVEPVPGRQITQVDPRHRCLKKKKKKKNGDSESSDRTSVGLSKEPLKRGSECGI